MESRDASSRRDSSNSQSSFPVYKTTQSMISSTKVFQSKRKSHQDLLKLFIIYPNLETHEYRSALRAIFDHVSLQIENLVAGQIAQVREKNLEVKAILLVGGFGESKYLLERLRNAHRNEGIAVTQVVGA